MPPKKRSSNKHLPQRVYFKHNAYYYVDLKNKWHRLGGDLGEAMRSWSEILDIPLQMHNKTMDILFDRYLVEIAPQKAKSTYNNYFYYVKFLKMFFGPMNVDEVTPVLIYEYMGIRKKDSLYSANHERELLSSIFNEAIRWGIIRDNPCKNVKPYPKNKRNRYIEDWEFNAVQGIASPLIQCVMQLAYLTGLRLGDILSIKMSDIAESGINISINKTKNKITIEWSDSLREVVQKSRGIKKKINGLYLFTTNVGQPYTASGFKGMWQRLMAKALGVIIVEENGKKIKKNIAAVITERFRFHDIRRKAATDKEKLHGREEARKFLGHATQQMTANYIAGPVKVKPVK